MSTSGSSEWIVKAPEGLATIINGDIYFSPNSTRPLKSVPWPTTPWRFVENVSTAADFQEPRWWTVGTEWLGFVPKQPVPYAGVWFGPLGIIPNKLLCENQVEYKLPVFYSDKWLEIDYMLWETCEILRENHGLKYALPFPPRRWHYHKAFQSWATAMEHITKGRDWFGMWLGLLYWSTQKIPNGPNFAEGLTPPEWFKTVVFKRSNKVNGSYVDAIRTSQLLQNWWQIERVGLFLLHPLDAPGQPVAQWFVQQNVPVWYRWGERECRTSKYANFTLITPSPEHLQKATSWISSSPTTYESHSMMSSAPGRRDDSPEVEDSFDYPPASAPLPAFDNWTNPSSSSSVPPPQAPPDGTSNVSRPKERVWINQHGDPVWDYGSGRSVWEPFFKKQEERHLRKLEKETPKAKQARESRMRQPPRTSCPVFVWDWDDADPPKFVRTRVRNDEREDTLNSYSDKQKKYNAFDNEWDCCRDWGEDADEEDYVEPLPAHVLPPKTDQELLSERLGIEVSRLLYEYYGWVVPLPLPPPGNHISWIPEEDRKSFKAVLGLQSAPVDSTFFYSPLAKAASPYIRLLAGKDNTRPSGDVWDLLQDNRLCLAYTTTLNCIRTLKRKEETWYMFDFDSLRTVPWNIAVPTATTALMICRLKERLDERTKDRLDESAVVRELLMEGIRFHTVLRREVLGAAEPDPPSTYMPMRLSDHVFSIEDLNLYQRQCRQIMSSPRARAALMRGGFIRRRALEFMLPSEALRGPCGTYEDPGMMFIAHDVNGVEYVDDELTDEEYDLLSGVYLKFTGDNLHVAKVSWLPQCWVYEGCGLDLGRWTEHAEGFWKKRTEAVFHDKAAISEEPLNWEKRIQAANRPKSTSSGDYHNVPSSGKLGVPLNVSEWRSKLRGLGDARRAWSKVEMWSKEYILDHVGSI